MVGLKTTEINKAPVVRRSQFTLYWKYRYMFMLLLPGLVSLLIFAYYPMYGIIIAFKDFKFLEGILGSKWIGFKYFIQVFTLPESLEVIKNTLILNIYSLVVGFPATIIFALLLNEIRISGVKKAIQTITYLPNFLSWVVVSGLVMDLLSPSRGLVNKIIMLLGGESVYFLAEPSFFRSIIVFSGLWKGIGWSSIIYLASISNANPELYDAAYIDGAGRIKRAIHVTLPAMYPMITIGLIFSVSALLSGGDFEQIFNFLNSQTKDVGRVLSVYIFQVGLGKYQYSFSTALGIVNQLVCLIMLVIANQIAKRFSEYTLW
ncbi:MAG: sugar ABC transporter permease [Ruminiclostridium sp.]|nr:sugar ABC transporter permease [Ruminiclostridium sp.]